MKECMLTRLITTELSPITYIVIEWDGDYPIENQGLWFRGFKNQLAADEAALKVFKKMVCKVKPKVDYIVTVQTTEGDLITEIKSTLHQGG